MRVQLPLPTSLAFYSFGAILSVYSSSRQRNALSGLTSYVPFKNSHLLLKRGSISFSSPARHYSYQKFSGADAIGCVCS